MMVKIKSIYLLVIILVGLLLTTFLIFTPNQKSLIIEQNIGQDKITGSRPNIEQVIQQYEADLIDIDGVVGLGISECQQELCIKVYLESKSPKLKKKIPTKLGKFKVDTEVIGSVEPLPQQ